MATMTLTIPDDKIATVISDLCLVYNYTLNKESETETQTQFARRMIRGLLLDSLRNVHNTALSMQNAPYADITVT